MKIKMSMNKEKLPTIKLQGKEYVQVKDRVLFFNEMYPTGKIETKNQLIGQNFMVMAKVTPDVTILERFFTGHSYGQANNEKAFEKLETVAVGRALAFMGIGVIEGVASAEEMESFTERLAKPTSQDDLSRSWGSCPKDGGSLRLKEGQNKKTGKAYRFWGCENYPKCDYSTNTDPSQYKKKPEEEFVDEMYASGWFISGSSPNL